MHCEDVPWCIFLSCRGPYPGLHKSRRVLYHVDIDLFDMIQLRATCHGLRNDQTNDAFLRHIGVTYLGLSLDGDDDCGRKLMRLCTRAYVTRRLIANIPRVVAYAAKYRHPSAATNTAIVAGSFALHAHITATEGRPAWEPSDIDIFIPFGHTEKADEAWHFAISYVKQEYGSIMNCMFGEIMNVQHDHYFGEAEMQSPEDAEMVKPLTYNTLLVRRALKENEDFYFSDGDELHRSLDASNILSLLPVENQTVGLSRPCQIYRSSRIKLKNDHKPLTHKSINIVQYVGPPVEAAELVSSFDILNCQVALRVVPDTLKYEFQVSREVKGVIYDRTLSLTKYAWPPLYRWPDQPLSEISDHAFEGCILRQIDRIDKYMRRGFYPTGHRCYDDATIEEGTTTYSL